MMSELHGSEGLALRSDELNLIIKTGYSLMSGIWFPATVAQPVSSPIGRLTHVEIDRFYLFQVIQGDNRFRILFKILHTLHHQKGLK